MVVDDLNFVCFCALPLKDDAPAFVDPHAVVALEVSFEELEPISRG
jgi:hypothetical protein